ncbi:NAD(P)H-hydrate dehydratase [Akkermansiaceae bacterium]|nr:NAD(P)H-hydrate dehydratase [Akkermansiaceae bacterium]
MKAVRVEEMRAIEARAMAAGIPESELMAKAGHALGQALGNAYPKRGAAIAYPGKGHNGGDALIALRVLRDEFGWDVSVRAAFPADQWAPLAREQLQDLVPVDSVNAPPGPLLLIDGLLGMGAEGAPRGAIAGMIAEMELLRSRRGALIAAVDVPSGTDPDSGVAFPGAVTADATFMIGAAKRGLLMGRAADACGTLHLVPVDGLEAQGAGDMELVCPQAMGFGKRPRPFDFHKGMAGRVGILAGSPQFTGAALLSALGAIRAGGGLVTLHAPSRACDAMLARLPLEAMLVACDDPATLLTERYDSLVIGPGLGRVAGGFADGLAELVATARVPAVIDADALELIAARGIPLSSLHLLTPHPGEFAGLAPGLCGLSREDAARAFVSEREAVLLLKGARSIIAKRGTALRINSTGTPAMSNGGQGDLLSGVLGALLAGGMDAFDAAALGAWLCGRAAEISFSEKGSPSTATSAAGQLGLALRDWGSACR